MVGTIIEWYDYALYGAASGLVISKLFFPNLSAVNGVLAAFATFAVGYFIRPLGGIILSHIGDKFGRKPALILTIILMASATVAMGLLPTFGQIGVWAPVLLVLLRMVQGFGAGGRSWPERSRWLRNTRRSSAADSIPRSRTRRRW